MDLTEKLRNSHLNFLSRSVCKVTQKRDYEIRFQYLFQIFRMYRSIIDNARWTKNLGACLSYYFSFLPSFLSLYLFGVSFVKSNPFSHRIPGSQWAENFIKARSVIEISNSLKQEKEGDKAFGHLMPEM